jgi:cell division protease FtsH
LENKHLFKAMPGISWIWWIIFIFLLAWTSWTLWLITRPEAGLSYSAFISQVKSGNVSKVEIRGSEIDGTFVKPVSSSQNSAGLSSLSLPTFNKYSSFRTIFPETIGDPNLIPMLTTHSVEVDVIPPFSTWFTVFSASGIPVLLLLLVIAWMAHEVWKKRTTVNKFRWDRIHQPKQDGLPKITFGDVAGNEEAKAQLKYIVNFLHPSENYSYLATHIPKGILLIGPHGSGKTLLACAVAGEVDVPFYSINASELVEMPKGREASLIHELFTQARTSAPCIVFIDELDTIGHQWGSDPSSRSDQYHQALDQLLEEMDGLGTQHRTLVMAAATRPEGLEPALLASGRFDRQITLSLPDRAEREATLGIHTRGIHLAPDVDLHIVARTTTGLSGADLSSVCREAALIASRQHHSQVNMSDFEEALDRFLLATRRSALLDDHARKAIAYHEAGHALVAWLTPTADPVQKVTLIQHELVLGFTDQISSAEGYHFSQEYLLACLSVLLGGRAAEDIAIGDLTTGAEQDLLEATRLARRMATRWGMGSLGPVALNGVEGELHADTELALGREYSEEMAARIDQDVLQLLEGRYQAVRSLLDRSRQKLDQLAEVLLKDETIGWDGLINILGQRPI